MDKLSEQYAWALAQYVSRLRSSGKFYTHIIGIDPGGTTGIAVMELNDPTSIWISNLKYSEGLKGGAMPLLIRSFINNYNHVLGGENCNPLVIVENFRARTGRAIATAGFINVPERLIGAIQTICITRDIDCFLVEPDEHKSYMSDYKSKIFCTVFEVNQPKVIHERDALTILHYGLYKFGKE